jgi:hypothetical protein
LRVLAEWLHASPDELRFDTTTLTMQDRDMLAKYSALSVADRKTVCDVVLALAVAASVKLRGQSFLC